MHWTKIREPSTPQSKWSRANVAAGRCRSCSNPAAWGRTQCDACAARTRTRSRERRDEERVRAILAQMNGSVERKKRAGHDTCSFCQKPGHHRNGCPDNPDRAKLRAARAEQGRLASLKRWGNRDERS